MGERRAEGCCINEGGWWVGKMVECLQFVKQFWMWVWYNENRDREGAGVMVLALRDSAVLRVLVFWGGTISVYIIL